MATNKHATIRYHALDLCFSNFGRKYFIDDLVNECNLELYEFSGITEGVKRRQVFEDIKFMESDQGWSIQLDRIKVGKKVYYRYAEKNYSIKNQALNKAEALQVNETLSLLKRFKGMPQFDWIDEMQVRFESSVNSISSNKTIVGFEQNPFLKGLNFFTDLFNAIQYKKVLEINYKGYKQATPSKIILHPYFLKQYNNRWFLFGYNNEFKAISNLAIDRIVSIEELNLAYIENNFEDFEEYFDDMVGVTIKSNQEPQKIILEIDKNYWPYIESKPIHGSQKIKYRDEYFVIIELDLILNFEFTSVVFSFGSNVKVIEPIELKTSILEKAQELIKKYN